MTYISERGKIELEWMRVGKVPEITGHPNVELLASLPSDECGCPEEIWQIDGLVYLIHFEQDGSGEITSFHSEDGEEQFTREVKTVNELRSALFLVHQEIISRPEA